MRTMERDKRSCRGNLAIFFKQSHAYLRAAAMSPTRAASSTKMASVLGLQVINSSIPKWSIYERNAAIIELFLPLSSSQPERMKFFHD
jgi:hypothetical protein